MTDFLLKIHSDLSMDKKFSVIFFPDMTKPPIIVLLFYDWRSFYQCPLKICFAIWVVNCKAIFPFAL